MRQNRIRWLWGAISRTTTTLSLDWLYFAGTAKGRRKEGECDDCSCGTTTTAEERPAEGERRTTWGVSSLNRSEIGRRGGGNVRREGGSERDEVGGAFGVVESGSSWSGGKKILPLFKSTW